MIFCILGFRYNALSENKGSMLALYVIAQFLFNWGPNTTTFIVPGECFPTRYRASGHGLSAAMGKIGAIIAQVVSVPLLSKDAPANCTGTNCSPWLGRLMQIFALFMLCGTLVSLLIPETKGLTLEELAGEAPTSYNAGRNGSIRSPTRKWWRPFQGGQPAGFFYPRATRKNWARGQRVGIMTSPEIAAQQAHENIKNKKWKRKRGGSEDTDHYDFESTSSTAGIVAAGAAAGTGTAAAAGSGSGTGATGQTADPSKGHGGVFPGWGVGWGRIDRGGNPTSVENIGLQDVGNLLR